MSSLYICPTPIGNLSDITLRTIQTLQQVDVIAAEDTRRTLRLLNHLQIKKTLFSLHEHNEEKQSQHVIDLIRQGKEVALVSDAGMPGISDPGEKVIKACIQEGIPVIVLPGPSAAIMALVGSGLSTSRFSFIGFLDRNSKKRKKQLEEILSMRETLIFYEAPHRAQDTLIDMYRIFGNRSITVARELTKKFEEYIRTNLQDITENPRQWQGELVLILEGATTSDQPREYQEEEILEMLKGKLDQGMSVRDASKEVASQLGMKKSQVYALALTINE